MTRGAIFIDYSYFCRITLFQLKDADWIVRNIKKWSNKSERIKEVDEWVVYAYDAKYKAQHAKHVRPGIMEKVHEDLNNIAAGGIILRLGDYALRFKVNGKMLAHKGGGDPFFVQKGVDSLLVIDAMDELHVNNADVFCFITGDRDFIPVFKRLQEEEKLVMVYYSSVAAECIELKESAKGNLRDISKETWIQTSTRREE